MDLENWKEKTAVLRLYTKPLHLYKEQELGHRNKKNQNDAFVKAHNNMPLRKIETISRELRKISSTL